MSQSKASEEAGYEALRMAISLGLYWKVRFGTDRGFAGKLPPGAGIVAGVLVVDGDRAA
jgi:hypothetical protein